MMAQAEQNAQQSQDPIVQMQQRELALKEQQAAAKAQTDMAKVQVDAQKAQAKTMLDLEKMDQEERLESAKIAAKVAMQDSKEEAQQEIEGFKAGFNLIKDTLDEKKATNNVLKAIQNDLRTQMNEVSDHMAMGGCKDMDEYSRNVGIIQGLAFAERTLLDLDERLERE